MGIRPMPLTLRHLCVHALELERRIAARYVDYAQLLRAWGATPIADAFDELANLQEQELRALEAGAQKPNGPGTADPNDPWQETLPSQPLETTQPFLPRNVRQALQVIVAMERKAETHYADAAENARDPLVRDCAAEMCAYKHKRLELLACLLACAWQSNWIRTASWAFDRAMPANG